MADVYFLDSVKVATSTTGTGSVTVGAAEPGYLTPAEAGAVDGRVYAWRLDDGDDFEIFIGTYSSTGPTVSRDEVKYSKIGGVAGTTKLTLSGSAKLSAVPAADYVVTPRQIREKLTADRTYYVRTDGSDSNDGLTNSAGGAFATIQKAVDVIAETLDINANTVTIQVGDGTYTGAVSLKNAIGFAAAGNLVIQGNSSTPSNVVISTTSATAFEAIGLSSTWDIKDLKIQTTTSGLCIDSTRSHVRFGNLVFGACADVGHIRAKQSSVLEAIGDYEIAGSCARHLILEDLSIGLITGRTITLTGTPAFSAHYCLVSDNAVFRANGCTFSGSATGSRYSVSRGAVIITAGAGTSYFPGDAAGFGTDFNADPWGLYI